MSACLGYGLKARSTTPMCYPTTQQISTTSSGTATWRTTSTFSFKKNHQETYAPDIRPTRSLCPKGGFHWRRRQYGRCHSYIREFRQPSCGGGLDSAAATVGRALANLSQQAPGVYGSAIERPASQRERGFRNLQGGGRVVHALDDLQEQGVSDAPPSGNAAGNATAPRAYRASVSAGVSYLVGADPNSERIRLRLHRTAVQLSRAFLQDAVRRVHVLGECQNKQVSSDPAALPDSRRATAQDRWCA